MRTQRPGRVAGAGASTPSQPPADLAAVAAQVEVFSAQLQAEAAHTRNLHTEKTMQRSARQAELAELRERKLELERRKESLARRFRDLLVAMPAPDESGGAATGSSVGKEGPSVQTESAASKLWQKSQQHWTHSHTDRASGQVAAPSRLSATALSWPQFCQQSPGLPSVLWSAAAGMAMAAAKDATLPPASRPQAERAPVVPASVTRGVVATKAAAPSFPEQCPPCDAPWQSAVLCGNSSRSGRGVIAVDTSSLMFTLRDSDLETKLNSAGNHPRGEEGKRHIEWLTAKVGGLDPNLEKALLADMM